VTTSAIRRLFIQLQENLRTAYTAVLRQSEPSQNNWTQRPLGIQPVPQFAKITSPEAVPGSPKRTVAFLGKRLAHADLCMNLRGCPQTKRVPVPRWPSIPHGERHWRLRSRCECRSGLPRSRLVASLVQGRRGPREIRKGSFRHSMDVLFDRMHHEKQWCEHGRSRS
jgi:hypothetical protein